MSGKTRTGKPRRHPGVKGPNPHLKAMRQREAEERRLKHEAEGAPRSRKKRLASKLAEAAAAAATSPDKGKRKK